MAFDPDALGAWGAGDQVNGGLGGLASKTGGIARSISDPHGDNHRGHHEGNPHGRKDEEKAGCRKEGIQEKDSGGGTTSGLNDVEHPLRMVYSSKHQI